MIDHVTAGGARRRGSRRPRGDDGQGMFPVLVLVALSVLLIGFSIIQPWGAATTDKTRSQTAADAAALAGAQEVRETWLTATAPALTVYLVTPLGVITPGTGTASADGYARSNDAHVTRAYALPGEGRFVVEVENDTTADVDTGLARARATTEMDVDFLGCFWTDPLPPPPPPPLGDGPPDFERTMRCGGWEAEYEFLNTPPLYKAVSYAAGESYGDVYNDLEPRLVD